MISKFRTRKGWRGDSFKHGLCAKGIKTGRKITIRFLSANDFNRLPEEIARNKKGELSYAQSVIKNDSIDISVRDTRDLRVRNKLVRHELEEIKIFKKLDLTIVKNPEQTAHKMNPVKLTNKEVDNAFGDIGDPK